MDHLHRVAIVVGLLASVAVAAKPGRVKFNDILITKAVDRAAPMIGLELVIPARLKSHRANAVFAGWNRRAGGGRVSLFAASLGVDGYRALMADGSVRKASGGKLNLELMGPPMARAANRNRIEELGTTPMAFDELRITLLQPGPAGSMKEVRTVRLLGARLLAMANTASGGPPAQGAATLTYTGFEPAPAITSAGGGVWKTINK